ncbi:MAG: hypothetical protein HC849_32320, partial [Oscillatoriales cyanobacterium RU_3_3]|nr:hypothetical protein [Oscillatoriales cyanobacterium RU_3_3]
MQTRLHKSLIANLTKDARIDGDRERGTLALQLLHDSRAGTLTLDGDRRAGTIAVPR